MKKVISVLCLAVFLLAATLPGALATSLVPASNWDQLLAETLRSVQAMGQENGTLEVNGSSFVTAAPDMASINLGISVQDPALKTAQEQANQTAQDVLDALLALGIPKEDITTSNYNVSPVYDYSGETTTLTGYRVTNQLQITLRDLTKLNDAVDTAVEKGANEIGSLSFGVLDQSPLYAQALQGAIADAQGKAEAMAKAAGKTLGRLIQVVEQSAGAAVMYEQRSYAVMDSAAGGTNLQAGQTEVRASVKLVYELN